MNPEQLVKVREAFERLATDNYAPSEEDDRQADLATVESMLDVMSSVNVVERWCDDTEVHNLTHDHSARVWPTPGEFRKNRLTVVIHGAAAEPQDTGAAQGASAPAGVQFTNELSQAQLEAKEGEPL